MKDQQEQNVNKKKISVAQNEAATILDQDVQYLPIKGKPTDGKLDSLKKNEYYVYSDGKNLYISGKDQNQRGLSLVSDNEKSYNFIQKEILKETGKYTLSGPTFSHGTQTLISSFHIKTLQGVAPAVGMLPVSQQRGALVENTKSKHSVDDIDVEKISKKLDMLDSLNSLAKSRDEDSIVDVKHSIENVIANDELKNKLNDLKDTAVEKQNEKEWTKTKYSAAALGAIGVIVGAVVLWPLAVAGGIVLLGSGAKMAQDQSAENKIKNRFDSMTRGLDTLSDRDILGISAVCNPRSAALPSLQRLAKALGEADSGVREAFSRVGSTNAMTSLAGVGVAAGARNTTARQ